MAGEKRRQSTILNVFNLAMEDIYNGTHLNGKKRCITRRVQVFIKVDFAFEVGFGVVAFAASPIRNTVEPNSLARHSSLYLICLRWQSRLT